MKTLLLGLGNPILGDDGIGNRLVGELRQKLPPIPCLEIVDDCSAGGLGLLDIIAGYDRLVVVDAICTAGGAPGDWYRFDPSTLAAARHLGSLHDASFATALQLGRLLGMPLPPDEEIHIFAIEAGEVATFTEELSEPLRLAYPAVRDEVFGEMMELLMPAACATGSCDRCPACGPRPCGCPCTR